MRLLLLTLIGTLWAVAAQAACSGRLVETDKILHSPLCIPEQPQRIVTLDPTYNLGMALELGLPVVGAPLFGMQDARLQALAKEKSVADVGHAGEPSVERIIGLKPDLILGDATMHAQAYDLASQVAPTVLVDAGSWKEHFATLAAATGRTAKADELFKAYDARVADIRSRMPNIKISVIRIMPSGFQVYLDGPAAYAPFAIMKEAGVARTAYETTTGKDFMKRPDWEELSALDGDVLLYMVGSGYDPDANGKLEAETLANPLWQLLPAVRAGRAYRVEIVTWMGFGGFFSANKVLDDIERYIVKQP